MADSLYVVGEDDPGTGQVRAMHISYYLRHSENYLEVFVQDLCEYFKERWGIADHSEALSRYAIFKYEIGALEDDVVERLARLQGGETVAIERGARLGS